MSAALKARVAQAALWSAGVLVVHCSVSLFAYNLRHPELTQMQVLMSVVEAVTWK